MKETDILILGRQSNMQGQSETLSETETAEKLHEIPACMNPYVGGHYSALGLKKPGEAAGQALGQYRMQT
jgi:hypothetical protein